MSERSCETDQGLPAALPGCVRDVIFTVARLAVNTLHAPLYVLALLPGCHVHVTPH